VKEAWQVCYLPFIDKGIEVKVNRSLGLEPFFIFAFSTTLNLLEGESSGEYCLRAKEEAKEQKQS
jgi:hypothetical protein